MKPYLPTLPVFPRVSKFFIKSPGLPVSRLEHQISREIPNVAHNTWKKVGAVFARCLHSKQRLPAWVSVRCKKEFLGALPSGFEGVKRLASQKVKEILLVDVQPSVNIRGKLLCGFFENSSALKCERVRAASCDVK